MPTRSSLLIRLSLFAARVDANDLHVILLHYQLLVQFEVKVIRLQLNRLTSPAAAIWSRNDPQNVPIAHKGFGQVLKSNTVLHYQIPKTKFV